MSPHKASSVMPSAAILSSCPQTPSSSTIFLTLGSRRKPSLYWIKRSLYSSRQPAMCMVSVEESTWGSVWIICPLGYWSASIRNHICLRQWSPSLKIYVLPCGDSYCAIVLCVYNLDVLHSASCDKIPTGIYDTPIVPTWLHRVQWLTAVLWGRHHHHTWAPRNSMVLKLVVGGLAEKLNKHLTQFNWGATIPKVQAVLKYRDLHLCISKIVLRMQKHAYIFPWVLLQMHLCVDPVMSPCDNCDDTVEFLILHDDRSVMCCQAVWCKSVQASWNPYLCSSI